MGQKIKVLFLDIDGVLNKLGETSTTATLPRYCCPVGFDAELVDNFVTILKAIPDVKIVLSTAWRDMGSTEAFELAFATWGVGVNIISKTPNGLNELFSYGIKRGLEITSWLNSADHQGFSIEEYVVLDDRKDAGFGHEDRFVFTNYKHGLTKEKAEQAIRILQGELNAEERHATQSDTYLDWAQAEEDTFQGFGKS